MTLAFHTHVLPKSCQGSPFRDLSFYNTHPIFTGHWALGIGLLLYFVVCSFIHSFSTHLQRGWTSLHSALELGWEAAQQTRPELVYFLLPHFSLHESSCKKCHVVKKGRLGSKQGEGAIFAWCARSTQHGVVRSTTYPCFILLTGEHRRREECLTECTDVFSGFPV